MYNNYIEKTELHESEKPSTYKLFFGSKKRLINPSEITIASLMREKNNCKIE